MSERCTPIRASAKLSRTSIGVTAALLIGLLIPTAATAQGLRDPSADTPSGTIYEIPLEGGRDYASPLGSGADGGSSRYRSENNFGSSSRVPGAAGDGGSTLDDDSPPDGGSGSGGSSGGGSSGGDGTREAGSGTDELRTSGSGDAPSRTWLLALVGAIVLGALFAGGVAARARHAAG